MTDLTQALDFLQDRIGPLLRPGSPMGADEARTTLGMTYPMIHAKKTDFKNRMGAMGQAAILVDSKQTIFIEKFSEDFAAEVASRGATVGRTVKDFSLRKGVLEWLLSPERLFPLIAIMPDKGSVANAKSLRLSHSESAVRVCSPGQILEFNARRVRELGERIDKTDATPAQWRDACLVESRGPITSADGYDVDQVNAYKKKSVKLISLLGEDLYNDLPLYGSGDYLALFDLFIKAESLKW